MEGNNGKNWSPLRNGLHCLPFFSFFQIKFQKKGRAFIFLPVSLGGIFILMQLDSVVDSGNEVSYDQALVCLTKRKQSWHIVERKKTMNPMKSSCIHSFPYFTIKGSEETGPCSVSVSSRGKYCNVTRSIVTFY